MSALALDAMFPLEPATAGVVARELESQGFSGLWTNETPHDPFLPVLAAALTTTTMTLGTGVATAFTRSPMVTALTAWDLQKASDGRFALGLGAQVKAHNARRYSTPVESPGRQMRELIAALRHVWGAFQGEHRLDFHGAFYTLDLLTPLHSPGPIEHPHIPIYVAAVGEYMYRLAGELADGVHVHSFNSAEYLRDIALPALEVGLDKSGRNRSDVTLVSSLFAVVGADSRMDKAVRSQIAFYASTTSYRGILELHGWGDLTDTLKPLVRAGDVDAMAAAITDDVVEAFAIVAPTWDAALRKANDRFGGLLDRIGFYSLQDMVQLADAPAIASAHRAVDRAVETSTLG
jgi:probable F420-dependent oxidoreductase